MLCSQRRPTVTVFLDQSIRDVSRFCTYVAPANFFSPLSADDTFNVANHYLVQTVYQNLSVLNTYTLKHPWFPGPCAFVRNIGEAEHRIFWQAAKRANPLLSGLRVLGTDDDKAIYNAILNESDNLTHHILGLEHVKKNISAKLAEFHFPKGQLKVIMDDIFITLYNCETKDYDDIVTDLKKKWKLIETKYTRNEKEKTFVNYFEKNKEVTFKNKLIKSARNSAHLTDDYWQNPVEWANHLVKDELRKKLGTVNNAKITDVVEVLKERNMRLYTNVCKAVYNTNGPYKLSPEFQHFEMSHDDWFALSQESKEQHLQDFFAWIPTGAVNLDESDHTSNETEALNQTTSKPTVLVDVVEHNHTPNETVEPLNQSTRKTTEANDAIECDQIPNETVVPPNETTRKTKQTVDIVESDQIPNETIVPPNETTGKTADAVNFVVSDQTTRKTLPISFEELNLSGVIPNETLRNIFKEAENLINMKDGITSAATNDARVRTVKNSNSNYPLIVAPNKKNRNVLECKCKTYTWYNLCAHTIAVACDIKISFDFFVEVKKKLNLKAKKRGLTKALEKDLTDKERGMKLDEIAKKNNRKRKQNNPLKNTDFNVTLTVPPIPISTQNSTSKQPCASSSTISKAPSTSLQNADTCFIEQNAETQDVMFSQDNYATIPLQPTDSYQQQPAAFEVWHAGMSPYHYELIPLPNNVQKCYGCGQQFADCYRYYPNNLIVRHRDRRVMGSSISGHLIYNKDYQFTYYHLKRDHMARKNPLFRNNPVIFADPESFRIFMTDPACQSIRNTLDVIIQPTPM